ncbi:MAG: MGH1-like glycoside hydrolase domain-containing protein [Spirochaetia bacterium]
MKLPYLQTENEIIARAFRIALGDIVTNIQPWKIQVPEERTAPVLLAGLDYDRPWTRDASYHAFFGLSGYMPDITEATLLSALVSGPEGPIVGGQYWDAVIWVSGAWRHYCLTGNRQFLTVAREAAANTLRLREKEEYDPDSGLFRGPALLGDGISAYPDRYAQTGGSPCILDWPAANPNRRHPDGIGIPMKSLSTNCLYFGAYTVIREMEEELDRNPDEHWPRMAQSLFNSINGRFWSNTHNRYGYLSEGDDFCDYQECLGHAFALLTKAVPEERIPLVLKNTYISQHGIPCVWPSFPRYRDESAGTYGRHSGTVWPHAQATWAMAAASVGGMDHLSREFRILSEHASKDEQFLELYHPETGERYAGEQEYTRWKSCGRQSWCATGYIGLILLSVLGLQPDRRGIHFKPRLPDWAGNLHLSGITVRGKQISVSTEGSGTKIVKFTVNGGETDAFIPYSRLTPECRIEMKLK